MWWCWTQSRTQSEYSKKPSICHWNLNSIPAQNFQKLLLLKAFKSIHKFDIICLSETYLDSSISHNDSNLEIPRYNWVHSYHPSNKKRGGVCIYYKSYLPLVHCSFFEDATIIFINKTDPKDPNRREHYWRHALKTMAHLSSNVEND